MNDVVDRRDLSLRDLILTMKGDRTYAGLEAASDGVVKAQRWNQIANGLKVNEFPEPRTMMAIAHALNVEDEVVLHAFAKALGMDIRRRRSVFADLLPPMVDRLNEQQQSAVLAVIRAMGDCQCGEGVQDEGYFVASKSASPGLPID